MKYLLLLAFLSPLFLHAQDSTRKDCRLKPEIDPYTKEKKFATGFVDLEGASVSIDATKAEVDILFSVKGVDKCFTDASTAAIFFVGTKAKQTQRNSGSMNCEGLFHFTFRNTTLPHFLLRKMGTMKIEKIVFTGNDKKETIVTLDADQQQILMDLAACIAQEGPTLLQ